MTLGPGSSTTRHQEAFTMANGHPIHVLGWEDAEIVQIALVGASVALPVVAGQVWEFEFLLTAGGIGAITDEVHVSTDGTDATALTDKAWGIGGDKSHIRHWRAREGITQIAFIGTGFDVWCTRLK